MDCLVTNDRAVKSVMVVGCGSIGKRHITNLLAIDLIEKIYVVTENQRCLEGLENSDKIIIAASTENIRADFAIIANETSKHMSTAIELAKAGMHLFIEKPLSHNLENIEVLKSVAEKYDLKIFIAYNLRFLGVFNIIREIIDNRKIGDLYFAKLEVGQYLPDWRPGRDYRDTYSASNNGGGGVALDLSHEIDCMRYLFGDPSSWKVFKTRVSNIQIETDDIFEGTYLFPNQFLCNVHMDYLQRKKTRMLRIVGSEGTIVCNFIDKHIQIDANNEKTLITTEDLFDINRTYKDELYHFFNVVASRTEPMITLIDGIKVLELLEDKYVSE